MKHCPYLAAAGSFPGPIEDWLCDVIELSAGSMDEDPGSFLDPGTFPGFWLTLAVSISHWPLAQNFYPFFFSPLHKSFVQNALTNDKAKRGPRKLHPSK